MLDLQLLETRQRIQQALFEVSSQADGRGNKRSQQARARLVRGLENGLLVVALGLRCSYLVDTISLETEECQALAKTLHRLGVTSLLILHEYTTSQVFFINVNLLRERLDSVKESGGAGELGSMIWIDVRYGRPITKLSNPPSYILNALQTLDKAVQGQTPGEALRFLDLKLVGEAEEMPPMAAWLLEYPTGYCLVVEERVGVGSTRALVGVGPGELDLELSGGGLGEGEIQMEMETEKEQEKGSEHRGYGRESSGRTNLGGEKLMLMEVVLKSGEHSVEKGKGKNDYTLLSFTYPSSLITSFPNPDYLNQTLLRRYQSRLSRLSIISTLNSTPTSTPESVLYAGVDNRERVDSTARSDLWTSVEVFEREVIVEGVSL